jgi:uridine kinase
MTYLVGIAGGSASGKTSILNDLKACFAPGQISVVSQDNYYLDRQLQALDYRGEINFDLPTAIDREALSRDVKTLMSGRSVLRQEYTFNNANARPGIVEVHPAPIVVIEGLFVFYYTELREMLDLQVYIDARDDIKLERRLQRDARERGYPETDVRYRWENHVVPCYKNYLRPYRDHCDIIIANNGSYKKGLGVLGNHLQAVLGKLENEMPGTHSISLQGSRTES